MVERHREPGVARGARAPTLAGESHKVVVAAIITTRAGKAMSKDAAFEVVAKGLANIKFWGVVVALAVKLADAGEFMPGSKCSATVL